jgi:primosomal protein N' (replication factor Y)
MDKTLYARVAINIPAVTGVFDYRIPNEMTIAAGCLVIAPFGKQIVQGVVMELIEAPSVAETKDLIDKLDPLPVITPAQIALAREMADSTLNPIAAIVGMMIPSGLNQQADVQYAVVSGQLSVISDQLTVVQKRLIDMLTKRGSLRGRQIDRHFANTDWRRSAQALIKRGVIQSQSILPPPSVRPKFIRTAQLAVTPDRAEAMMDSLGTKQTLSRRQSALRFLIREPDAINVSWVYAESGCNLADLEALAEQELIILRETEIFRDPLRSIDQKNIEEKQIQLTQDQQSALNEILPSLIPNPFLLHGVTGSGKTEIYLRAAEETLKRGKGVLILVPEIALTPQTVHRFLARFPGQVGLIHSKLSEGERYDTWRRIRSGAIKVVIGARSALFAPMQSIGLIVLDECHDPSYYQSEPPFYHALSAAQTYARLCGAVCVLGSATPPVAIKHRSSPPLAGEGLGMRELILPHRVTQSELPPVSIVDMREELKDGNRSIFSRALSESLAETIERGEQAILFLNRRGTATYVFCRNCGTTTLCPKCDTTLTLHVETLKRSNVETLLCHRCGYTRQMPKKCASCNSDQIRAFGLGSEKVEADVKALLPQARVLRWDWDTTRRKDAHKMILTHFANHNADILVGTQMLAKGLDLPLVTLVGIVLADVGINLPDPFAAERSFQTLTQVAGRAGRSSRGGRVILQTFQPENAVIQFASKHNYAGFYKAEIEQRQRLGYPPFMRLARLEYRHRDPLEAERITSGIAKVLRERIVKENRVQTEIIGAVPSYVAKVNAVHRWQIIVRAPDPVDVIRGIRLDGWRIEIDPVSLL